MRRIPPTAALLPLICVLACSSDGNKAEPDAGLLVDAAIDAAVVPSEISEFLDTIEGLTYTEAASVYTGYRRFVIRYTQPLDHTDPDGKTFEQRAVLLHRERTRPLVLYTSGYYLFSDDFLSELGLAMGANQLDVEQRFFAPSTPNPTLSSDWEKLRIEQAAADHHRFVVALEPYYTGAWLSTGHSKGGMTSVYHRRFYPDDVDATVAYVAPISFAAGDTRYHNFFDVVADATCRQALRDIQREMLVRRAAMLARLQDEIAGSGATFVRAGGLEAALEESIVGLPWSMFQTGSAAADCPQIPATTASDDAIFNFLFQTAGISSDSGIAAFSTYYYQAETELGYPSVPTTHLDDLLLFDGETDLLPTGVSTTYNPAPMPDVDTWIKNEASQILFVYGQFDPWFGGAFELGPGSSDSFLFVVDGANHGALIRDLAANDQEAALSAIERWTGVRPDLFARYPRSPIPPVPRLHVGRVR